MTKRQFDHILRAAGTIADVQKIYVFGSQSVLGSYPEASQELLRSQELDICPDGPPELSDVVDGAIGEGSMFHETFGYYAHSMTMEGVFRGKNWTQRLVAVSGLRTGAVVGLCLHPADLAISKLAAGREKDFDFVRILLQKKLVDPTLIRNILREEAGGPTAIRIAQALSDLISGIERESKGKMDTDDHG